MDRTNRSDGTGELGSLTEHASPLRLTCALQAYSLYIRIFSSSKVKQQRVLKAEILATKAELLQTSSQDQFAKWAKLRRKVDKGLADLEKLSE